MKTYKTEVVPETTRQVCIGRECDICGKTRPDEDWRQNNWDVENSTVSIRVNCERGTSYPECGDGKRIEIDICPDCFEDKLVPWINSQRKGKPPIEWSEYMW